jgi:hypothetical protein
MKNRIVDEREIDSTAMQTRWSNGCVVTSFLIEDNDAWVRIVEAGDEWLVYIEGEE